MYALWNARSQAFAFIGCFLFCFSIFFSYKRYANTNAPMRA
jgi:hypothetical protein